MIMLYAIQNQYWNENYVVVHDFMSKDDSNIILQQAYDQLGSKALNAFILRFSFTVANRIVISSIAGVNEETGALEFCHRVVWVSTRSRGFMVLGRKHAVPFDTLRDLLTNLKMTDIIVFTKPNSEEKELGRKLGELCLEPLTNYF